MASKGTPHYRKGRILKYMKRLYMRIEEMEKIGQIEKAEGLKEALLMLKYDFELEEST